MKEFYWTIMTKVTKSTIAINLNNTGWPFNSLVIIQKSKEKALFLNIFCKCHNKGFSISSDDKDFESLKKYIYMKKWFILYKYSLNFFQNQIIFLWVKKYFNRKKKDLSKKGNF